MTTPHKPPFMLPLHASRTLGFDFTIADDDGGIIALNLTESQADYILHCVNSHAKLVEAISQLLALGSFNVNGYEADVAAQRAAALLAAEGGGE